MSSLWHDSATVLSGTKLSEFDRGVSVETITNTYQSWSSEPSADQSACSNDSRSQYTAGSDSRSDLGCTPENYSLDPADPSNVLIFFDWDETLYPTTEFHDRWAVITDEHRRRIEEWENALCDFLELACQLSDKVVILTNAERPWVTRCTEEFAPKLSRVFTDLGDILEVAYAKEHLASRHHTSLRPLRHVHRTESRDEVTERMTIAKYSGMKRIAERFYGRRPWRNIISFGDMSYEHDALQQLTFKRAMAHYEDGVLSKAVLLSQFPRVMEMTGRLKMLQLILPALVQYGNDVDLDLSVPGTEQAEIPAAFDLPESVASLLPLHLDPKARQSL